MTKYDSISDVVTQLRITNRLLVSQLKSSGSISQKEIISLLATTGASAAEIADVLDTTAGTVATAMHRLKTKATSAKKVKKSAQKEAAS